MSLLARVCAFGKLCGFGYGHVRYYYAAKYR